MTRAGAQIHVETTVSRLQRRATARAIGQLSVIRDVTERERIEAALRESRAHLRFMLDSAGVGDWDLDLATFEARHSLRHDQCFGYTEPVPDWNPETSSSPMFIPRTASASRRRFKAALETRSDWHFECRVIWPDGSIHWIEVHGAIYRSGVQPARCSARSST